MLETVANPRESQDAQPHRPTRFGHLSFGLGICLGFRASDFEIDDAGTPGITQGEIGYSRQRWFISAALGPGRFAGPRRHYAVVAARKI